MTSVLATGYLISGVQDQTIGCPDMTPNACALGDGTFLVTVSTRNANYPDPYLSIIKVWHVGADGSVLGSTSIDSGSNFVDTSLGWAGGTKAILCVNFSPVAGGAGSNSTYLINASGGTPTVGSATATTFATKSTNIFGSYAFYDSASNQTVFFNKTGIALYSAVDGSQVASYTTNNIRWYGVNRKPGTTGTFGARTRENGTWGGYEVVLSAGSMTVTGMSAWAPSQDWWLLGAMDPYAAQLEKLEATSGNGIQVQGGYTVDLAQPAEYVNYEGINVGGGDYQNLVTYEVGSSGTPGDQYQIGLANITQSGTVTGEAIYLDWPTNSVSLSYCSYGGDYAAGKMILVGESTTQYESPRHYSLQFWVVNVGAAVVEPPVPQPDWEPAVLNPVGFITDDGARYLLNLMSGKEDPLPTYYLALCTAVPTEFQSGDELEEITAEDYTRTPVANGTGWGRQDTAFYNEVDIKMTPASAWDGILGWAICDAEQGGRVLFAGDFLDLITSTSGVELKIDRGTMGVAMGVTDWALES